MKVDMHCPNCREEISDHQRKLLSQNYIVYCENCGHKITPNSINRQNTSMSDTFTNNMLHNLLFPFNQHQAGYFHRMNLITVVFGAIHTGIIAVVTLMGLIPTLATLSAESFWQVLINGVIPIIIGLSLVSYDFFYASAKISQKDLNNYAIDFIFFGVLASIFAYLVGIYLLIKGVAVMFFALTDSSFFSGKYKKKFGEVFTAFTSTFSYILGFLILLIKNPFLKPENQSIMVYFYIALGVLILDFLVLRQFTKHKPFIEIPFWVGILKMTFGVIACFYRFAGIMLVIEGFLIIFISLFKIDWGQY